MTAAHGRMFRSSFLMSKRQTGACTRRPVCEVALIRREATGHLRMAQLSIRNDPLSELLRSSISGTPQRAPNSPRSYPKSTTSRMCVWVAHNAPSIWDSCRANTAARRVFVSGRIDTVHLARRHFHFASNRLASWRVNSVSSPRCAPGVGRLPHTLAVFESSSTRLISVSASSR